MKRRLAVLAFACATGVATISGQLGTSDIPAFHAWPPAKGSVLPPVLTERQLADQGMTQPVQTQSYKAAAKVSGVIYQMPCYCHCDKSHGHQSLRTCFESMHGANCGTCMAEALYAYQMSRKGWTAKMIREGIIRGDYRTMDLQHPEQVN
ncbi:MAG TPA: CYCXC family (seleno)protein [Verrucomicrobiae bacterium]|nr:CYCXC family (seleno)protein [Verrucomicrobiae bacterium]